MRLVGDDKILVDLRADRMLAGMPYKWSDAPYIERR